MLFNFCVCIIPGSLKPHGSLSPEGNKLLCFSASRICPKMSHSASESGIHMKWFRSTCRFAASYTLPQPPHRSIILDVDCHFQFVVFLSHRNVYILSTPKAILGFAEHTLGLADLAPDVAGGAGDLRSSVRCFLTQITASLPAGTRSSPMKVSYLRVLNSGVWVIEDSTWACFF